MIMIIKLIVITIIMIIINDININNIYISLCGLLCEITHIYILPIPPIPSKVDMQWDMRQFFDPSSTNSMAVGVSQA